MGANYAEAVYEQWADQLDPVPLLALVRMALVAPDKASPPIYWAGWEVLAFALGCNMPWEDDHSDEANRLRRNAARAVERVVKKLTQAGAISRLRRGQNGRQAEYQLHLKPVDKSRRSPTRNVGQDRPRNHAERGAGNHAERGAEPHAERGAEEDTGPTSRNTSRRNVSTGASSTAPDRRTA